MLLQFYYYILAASVLCIFAVVIVGRLFSSYLAAGIVSLLGFLAALAGAGIATWGNLKEAQGTHWNFLGFAFFDGLVCLFCFTRWKWSKRLFADKIKVMRSRSSNPQDVVLSVEGCRFPGTCWACGDDNAPLRTFTLSRVIVLPIAVGGESVAAPIPLCERHSDHMHLLPRWVLMLNGPLAFLLFLSPLIVLGDSFERYSSHFRMGVIWGALILSIGLYVYSIIWARKKKRFRLYSLDGPNGIMTVRFSDGSIAEKVRHEVESKSQ